MFLQSRPVILDSQLRCAWYEQPVFALSTALTCSAHMKRTLICHKAKSGHVIESVQTQLI